MRVTRLFVTNQSMNNAVHLWHLKIHMIDVDVRLGVARQLMQVVAYVTSYAANQIFSSDRLCGSKGTSK